MNGDRSAFRVSRGALVAVRRAGPPVGAIAFQYNPDGMSRRLQARHADSDLGGTRTGITRLAGPPIETISLSVELDATADPVSPLGVYPQLSALEMMLYPADTTPARPGTIQITPDEAPTVLFVWGPGRVLPVRLSGFTITEQAYDADLTPLRARVDLELRVLSTYDLPPDHPGHHLFRAHRLAKETLAAVGTGTSILQAGL